MNTGEILISNSASLGRGIFSKQCEKFVVSNDCVILFDGTFIYPLGEVDVSSELVDFLKNTSFKGMLGPAKNIKILLDLIKVSDTFVQNKKYAIWEGENIFSEVILNEHINIVPVVNTDLFYEFCLLKKSFLLEESEKSTELKSYFPKWKDKFASLYPVIIKYKNEVIGMASSNFQSDDTAMINMLFIKKEFRKRGYGGTLMRWYMNYLLQEFKNIHLFFSPENNSAETLYSKLGFKNIDDWLMVSF